MAAMTEMTVAGLLLDPSTGLPIVVLRDLEGKRAVPIWIGQLEAIAIASELEKIKHARPMTHDLLKNTIVALGFAVKRIEVNDLRDNTFFATIYLEKDGQKITVDSRPSDAIALAIRASARIWVADHVIEKAGQKAESADDKGEDRKDVAGSEKDRWQSLLDQLKPEDFGKYKQ
jgi:hypothetical protein